MEATETRNDILTTHDQVIKTIAARYKGRLDLDDAHQEARIVILENLHNYDPKKGNLYGFLKILIKRRLCDRQVTTHGVPVPIASWKRGHFVIVSNLEIDVEITEDSTPKLIEDMLRYITILPLEIKQIFEFTLKGWKGKDIAIMCDCDPAIISKRKKRGIEILRQLMS